jgi:acylphosphatase
MDVRFEGHVQGVGFRWTTARLAAGFPISGFVRNEPDGSVRLTAEGREADLLAFLQAIEISPVGRYISRRQVEWRDATGEFRAFEIGY